MAGKYQFVWLHILVCLVVMVFPCLVVRLRGTCLLQPEISRIVPVLLVSPEYRDSFGFQLCVSNIIFQLVRRCVRNTLFVLCLFTYELCYGWFVPACVSVGCIAYVWALPGLRSLCWSVIRVLRGTCIVGRLLCVRSYDICIYPPGSFARVSCRGAA